MYARRRREQLPNWLRRNLRAVLLRGPPSNLDATQGIVRLRPGGGRSSSSTEPMNQKIPNPDTRDLAKRLLAYEAAALSSSEHGATAVFRVSEKLRRPLSTLAGTTGFRMLLARSLTLAKTHAPGIGAIEVRPDGSLEGLSKLDDDGEAAEAGVVLIAQLLGLLGLFIGENLVLRLVLDVWPGLPALDPQKESET